MYVIVLYEKYSYTHFPAYCSIIILNTKYMRRQTLCNQGESYTMKLIMGVKTLLLYLDKD